MSQKPDLQFDPLADIVAFHERFHLSYNGPPRWLPDDLEYFRMKFMGEELAEYSTSDSAAQKEVLRAINLAFVIRDCPPSMEKQFDALIDIVYVALGTAYLHGFDFAEGWRRVHAANMAKVRALSANNAIDSGRDPKYDVVKPLDWVAPDLSDLV